MTVAERIYAQMPECVQAAIPSGGLTRASTPACIFYVILVTKITIKRT